VAKLDLSEIGGGCVEVFCQDVSSVGDEIFMTVCDFDGECAADYSTAIMDPEHARALAKMLEKAADECEQSRREE
jgi:hypothetical protein